MRTAYPDHLDAAALDDALDEIRAAPTGEGRLLRIARRPAVDEREVLDVGELDPEVGLRGDTWKVRGSSSTPDGSAHPGAQITLMNARVAMLLAGEDGPWEIAGDQLYVDFDLGVEHLPPGTRVAVGEAILEVSGKPHTGCHKFSARFGAEALRWVNSPVGRELRLRGLNTTVVQGGAIRAGDVIRKLDAAG